MPQGLQVFRPGRIDHIRRDVGARRGLVVIYGEQVIAHILLVIAFLSTAGRVGFPGPEPGGVGGHDFIDQDDIISIQAELKFGVRNDDSLFSRQLGTFIIDRQTDIPDLFSQRATDDFGGWSQAAQAVLSWDQETYMPDKGLSAKARQMALMSGIVHRRQIDPERGKLNPAADPELEKFGLPEGYDPDGCVERLLELQLTGDDRIVRTATPPINLKLSVGQDCRNWEAVARLDDRGFLLMTDKYPGTLLAYVPNPYLTREEE